MKGLRSQALQLHTANAALLPLSVGSSLLHSGLLGIRIQVFLVAVNEAMAKDC